MLILQVSCSNDSSLNRQYSSTQAIEIMPSFKIQIEWLHLSVVILYTAGLVITSTTYIHWVTYTTIWFNNTFFGQSH